jgi:hypothetical protein
VVKCGQCGTLLDESPDLPAAERQPCPVCGGLTRLREVEAAAIVGATASVELSVERGLNDLRVAVLGILVTIGLTVGFGVSGSWWVRVLSGLAAFAAASFLIWWRPFRKLMMKFVHALTGG